MIGFRLAAQVIAYCVSLGRGGNIQRVSDREGHGREGGERHEAFDTHGDDNYKVRFFALMKGSQWWQYVATVDLATIVTLDAPGETLSGINGWYGMP